MKRHYLPPFCETVRISCSHQVLTSSNQGFSIDNTPIFSATQPSLEEFLGLQTNPNNPFIF